MQSFRRRYNYLIVGAGIYGLALALELRRVLPDASIVVVEAGTLGEHAITVNTSGIIRHSYSDPEIHAAASYGLPFFRDPARAMDLPGAQPTFTRVGWARLLNDRHQPGSAAMAAAVVEQAHNLGHVQSQILSTKEFISQLESIWRSNVERCFDQEDFTHVVWEDDGGWADGSGSLRLFAAAARRHDVEIVFNTRVTDFKRKGDRVIGVLAARPNHPDAEPLIINADVVVLAAGLWLRHLVERATGLRMPVVPMYHQIVIAHTSPEFPLSTTQVSVAGGHTRTIVAIPVISYWRDSYFRPEGDGILIGLHHSELQAEDYVPRGGELPGGIRVGLDQAMLDALVASAPQIPLLAEGAIKLGSRAEDLSGGHYVMNPEEMPFEGPVPGTDHSLFVIGSGCGTGFKLGPGVARLLADRLLGHVRSFKETGHALSIERAEYFYPSTTPDSDLHGLFKPVQAGGRFRHIGAAGVAAAAESQAPAARTG
jgi:glycine/D-amino acid oxidase-like deaminating enzyme